MGARKGLFKGPVVDGVQTYYGPWRAVPEGWHTRYDEDSEENTEDGWMLWAEITVPGNIVQCRPPTDDRSPTD